MIKRVIFGIFLIISAFIFPWWVSAILAVIGLFYFENLYEVIFVGIIIDSLYGGIIEFFGFDFIFTAMSIILFFIMSKIKQNLLIGNK